eukprot:gene2674-5263_t
MGVNNTCTWCFTILISSILKWYGTSDALGKGFALDVRHSIAQSMIPPTRNFISLSEPTNLFGFRVLQFNILADGLSGLHPDLGEFSRISPCHLKWSYRKDRILNEILQYEPDIISLQEVDHYYDFFLPELSLRGYDGLFAPKPASSCHQSLPSVHGDG